MKTMKNLLATAALLAVLSAPAYAEEAGVMDNVKLSFGQAIKGIQSWFGDDTPETVEPAAGEAGFDVTNDDAMQIPPAVDPSIIEPAAGAGPDDDTLQVPPPYMGPDNSSTGAPRASAFDGNVSTTAFGDVNTIPVIDDFNTIAPASSETDATATSPTVDCAAIAAATANGEEVEDALVESCANGTANPAPVAETTTAPVELKSPAQPALEISPMPTEPVAEPATAPVTPEALPETQPATGE